MRDRRGFMGKERGLRVLAGERRAPDEMRGVGRGAEACSRYPGVGGALY